MLLEELLQQANTLHRHLCPGQVLGVRLAMLGCRAVGIEEPTRSKSLLVWVEIDRCATDAVTVVTGCRLGKRTLKFLDYGKVAATFLNLDTGDAVRVVARDDSRDAVRNYAPPELDKKEAQLYAYRVMPDEELFTLAHVRVEVSDLDLPGRPLKRVACDDCGEGVNDGREVLRAGRTLCKPCAEGAYYSVLESAIHA
ncbi:MAG: TraR/DksA C4-type zinc finger protein [Chloroflexi bacterium]|nr:TraR/DksA C4-type zinc finger protein [Chloroflexota bacterium]